jgi:hypothetical protein
MTWIIITDPGLIWLSEKNTEHIDTARPIARPSITAVECGLDRLRKGLANDWSITKEPSPPQNPDAKSATSAS